MVAEPQAMSWQCHRPVSRDGYTRVRKLLCEAHFRLFSDNASKQYTLSDLTIAGRKGRGPLFFVTGIDAAPFPRSGADAGVFSFPFTLPTRGSSFAAMEVLLGEGTGGVAPRPDVILDGICGTAEAVLVLLCSDDFADPPLVATSWPRTRPDCEILTLKVGDAPVGSLSSGIALRRGNDGALACLSPRLPPPMPVPVMFVCGSDQGAMAMSVILANNRD